MSEQEIRMECLRLALQGITLNGAKTVERAEAFYAFIKDEKSEIALRLEPQHTCQEYTSGRQ